MGDNMQLGNIEVPRNRSYVNVKRKKGKLRMKGRVLNIQINKDKGDGLDPGSLFFLLFSS